MDIEGDAVRTGEESGPFGQAHEALVIRDEGTVALTYTARSTHVGVSFHVAAE